MTNPKRDQNAIFRVGVGVVVAVYNFYFSEDLDVISMGNEFLVMIGKVCHHILFSFELKYLT